MEKAIAILIGNENGELSLRDFLAKVPETIRMRIKPSLLRDKGVSPIGSHAIIPVRLLSTHKKLTSNTTVITVEKFTGIDSEGKALLGGIADTREKAIELLSARFGQPDNATAYSYYVSQGFGYRQIEEQKIKEKKYASEQERMEKNFYVSLILPKDGPGYVEHWITCKRRANNMIMRGQINGTVYSIKNGLKKLKEHNRKFKGEESSANSNIE